jgi:hypothetical protein
MSGANEAAREAAAVAISNDRTRMEVQRAARHAALAAGASRSQAMKLSLRAVVFAISNSEAVEDASTKAAVAAVVAGAGLDDATAAATKAARKAGAYNDAIAAKAGRRASISVIERSEAIAAIGAADASTSSDAVRSEEVLLQTVRAGRDERRQSLGLKKKSARQSRQSDPGFLVALAGRSSPESKTRSPSPSEVADAVARARSQSTTLATKEELHAYKHRHDYCFVFDVPPEPEKLKKMTQEERAAHQQALRRQVAEKRSERAAHKASGARSHATRSTRHLHPFHHSQHLHTWERLQREMMPRSTIKPLAVALDADYFRTFWAEQRADQGGEDYVADRRDYAVLRTLFLVKLLNQKCGLSSRVFWSRDRDQIFCLIQADEQDVMVAAEREAFKLQFDRSIDVDDAAHNGCHAYTPFKHDANLLCLFQKYSTEGGRESVFRTVDRLKLIDHHMKEVINIDKLLERGVCASYFPIHESDLLAELESRWKRWGSLMRNEVPLGDVRDYFGEQIAFYFAWIAYYTDALFAPSAIGCAVFVWQMLERSGTIDVGDWEGTGTCIFAALMALWSTFLLEFWKRRQSVLALRWGTDDFEENEVNRPQFWGEQRESEAIGTIREGQWRGKRTIYYPRRRRNMKIATSVCLIVTVLGVVVLSVAGIMLFRTYLMGLDDMRAYGAVLAGSMNFVQIQIFNVAYTELAYRLTNWENWRTNTEYFDHLFDKLMVFRCINNFNSFFYLAFIKRVDTGCHGACRGVRYGLEWDEARCPALKAALLAHHGGDAAAYAASRETWPSALEWSPSSYEEYEGDCVHEVMIQLAVIFGSSVTLLNMIELGLPWLQARWKLKQEERHAAAANRTGVDARGRAGSGTRTLELSEVEEEATLADYDIGEEYSEVIITYGYVTLFVAAFPLTPLLARMSNVVEQYVDAHKLCRLTKRPVPEGAEDIGTWYTYLNALSKLAVLTNGALFAFTAGFFKTSETRFQAFTLFVAVIFLVQHLIAYSVEDEPEWVTGIKMRHQSLVSSLMFGVDVLDEEFDELVAEPFEGRIVDIYNPRADEDFSDMFPSGKQTTGPPVLPAPVQGKGLPERMQSPKRFRAREARVPGAAVVPVRSSAVSESKD